jgi:hypothetical protein
LEICRISGPRTQATLPIWSRARSRRSEVVDGCGAVWLQWAEHVRMLVQSRILVLWDGIGPVCRVPLGETSNSWSLLCVLVYFNNWR